MQRAFLILVAACLAAIAAGSESGLAQEAQSCQAGAEPRFAFGFAELAQALGDRMGEPTECEHVDAQTGYSVQRTTTGVATYHANINVPSFGTTADNWALTANGLVHWDSGAADPVAAAEVAATAKAIAQENTSPIVGASSPTAVPPATTAPAGAGTSSPNVALPANGRPDPSDIDVTLLASRDGLIAGDLWAVTGEIRNRSKDKPIWIVDKKTALMFAPEVYGTTRTTFTLIAEFATAFYDPAFRYRATWIRVDPGASYPVTWRFNSPQNPSRSYACKPPPGNEPDPLSEGSIYQSEPPAVFLNYTYFIPSTFKATAVVHVWYKEPVIDNENCVVLLENSFPVTITKDMPINAPPWVLIIGAAIGGFVCRTLQLVAGDAKLPTGVRGKARWPVAIGGIALGYVAAILLSGVATVLFSRLSTVDFPVAVKVSDIWGAFATGFVVQFFGYNWFKSRLFGQVAAATQPSVSIDPNEVKLADVAAGAATVKVSARGLNADAKLGSVDVVGANGKHQGSLEAVGLAPGLPEGSFEGTYRPPKTLPAGEYRVVILLTDGPLVTSQDKLRVKA